MGMSGWLTKEYNFFFQPDVDYSESNPSAIRALNVCYWFFISNLIDFFDAFFLVLRKKERQISGLHLYHHGMMPIFLWSGVRYVCGGHAIFLAFVILNALVRVVMYSYYLIAAMGPRFKKFIWWKKYLTTFQIVDDLGYISDAILGTESGGGAIPFIMNVSQVMIDNNPTTTYATTLEQT